MFIIIGVLKIMLDRIKSINDYLWGLYVLLACFIFFLDGGLSLYATWHFDPTSTPISREKVFVFWLRIIPHYAALLVIVIAAIQKRTIALWFGLWLLPYALLAFYKAFSIVNTPHSMIALLLFIGAVFSILLELVCFILMYAHRKRFVNKQD
jgi:hypothetical protein